MSVHTDMTGEIEMDELDFTTAEAPKATTFTSPGVDCDEVDKPSLGDLTEILESDSLGKLLQEDESFVLEPLQQPNEVRFRHENKVALRVTTAAASGPLSIQRHDARLLVWRQQC